MHSAACDEISKHLYDAVGHIAKARKCAVSAIAPIDIIFNLRNAGEALVYVLSILSEIREQKDEWE